MRMKTVLTKHLTSMSGDSVYAKAVAAGGGGGRHAPSLILLDQAKEVGAEGIGSRC